MMRIGKFTDFYRDVTKEGTKIPQEKYLKTGRYPIIDQGRQTIAGRWDSHDGIFEKIPAIVFGDHTRAIKYIEEPFFIGADGVKILRPINEHDNPKYLYYALQAARIPDLGYSRHFKAVKELEIRVYSAEKQDEIVQILEKIDHLIEQRHTEIGCIDQLVKSRFVEMFGDIPGEEKVVMADICRIITDGTHQPPQFVKTGIPFLFVSNIVTNEIHYDAEKFISEETYSELIKRTPIEIGDILLSTVGSYGHPAIVKSDKPFCFQRHIAYLKPDATVVNSEYLRGAILSADVQRQIDERVKGIAQKTLNLSEIRKLQLPLPSMEQQEQFAAFVKQIDKSKLVVQRSLEKLETLKKSLMQQYFG